MSLLEMHGAHLQETARQGTTVVVVLHDLSLAAASATGSCSSMRVVWSRTPSQWPTEEAMMRTPQP